MPLKLAAEFTRLTNKRLDLWAELDIVIDDLIAEGKKKKGKYMTWLQSLLDALTTEVNFRFSL